MLKKLSRVGNESGSSQLITTQMMRTAIVTQNGCAATQRRRNAGVAVMRSCKLPLISATGSRYPDGAGDEAGYLLRRALADRLVGDLVAAPQYDDAIGDAEYVGHAMADQHDRHSLVA